MKKNKLLAITGFLIFCNFLVLFTFLELRGRREFEVVFFDVGQGDAVLIKTSQGHNILIDGGPSKEIISHLSKEFNFWEREIDLIILTHAHADHLFGLVEILERFDVGKILWNQQEADTLIYRKWENLLDDVISKKAYKGQRINLGEVYLDVLYPPKNYQFTKDLNEGSVISRLTHADGAILFTGDAYKRQEKQLLEWEKECTTENYSWCEVMKIPSEILKAGHHGSSTSSDYDFVKRVSPEVAVISAGEDNRYGHPHEETLEVFNILEVDIHKTFKNGNFRVIID